MDESEIQEKITATNALIEVELDNWDKLGAAPKNIEIDNFLLDAAINALTSFLVEKNIIDDEEFTLYFKERILTNLVNARENLVEPAIKEIRRQQIINGLPNMDIPREH